MNAVLTAASELEKLHTDFQGWHVWVSAAGRCWAARLGDEVYGEGCHPLWQKTIDANTPEEMRAALEFQESISLPCGSLAA